MGEEELPVVDVFKSLFFFNVFFLTEDNDNDGVEWVLVGVFMSDNSWRVLSCCLLNEAKKDFMSPNVEFLFFWGLVLVALFPATAVLGFGDFNVVAAVLFTVLCCLSFSLLMVVTKLSVALAVLTKGNFVMLFASI